MSWQGVAFCHGCRRDGADVEDHGGRLLCAECAARARSLDPYRSTRCVVAGPGPGQEQPLVRQLLALYAAGEMAPATVRLGEMPATASEPMRLIAGDIRVRLGLLLAEGISLALPYATSEAVTAGYVRLKGSASYALGRLVDAGVIRAVGEMPKRGKGNGTKLFVPPGWHPTEPLAVAVERGGQQGLADLVWVPDEPGDAAGARAVQPDVEVADELLLVGGAAIRHDEKSTLENGGWGRAS